MQVPFVSIKEQEYCIIQLFDRISNKVLFKLKKHDKLYLRD